MRNGIFALSPLVCSRHSRGQSHLFGRVPLSIAIITMSVSSNGGMLIVIAGCLSVAILYVAIRSKPREASHADQFNERLGNASFSTYLIHPIVIAVILTFASRVFSDANIFAVQLICVVSATIVGLFVHCYVEIALARFFWEPDMGSWWAR